MLDDLYCGYLFIYIFYGVKEVYLGVSRRAMVPKRLENVNAIVRKLKSCSFSMCWLPSFLLQL